MSKKTKGTPKTNENTNVLINKYLAYTILGMGILYVLIARWRMLPLALERDEGEFGYIAQLILNGDNPFEAYNYKLPGTSLMYALFFSLFGDSIKTVHLGLLITNFITIVLLFFLTKKITQNSLVAAIASFFYGVAAVDFGVLGTAAHATHFINLFVVIGLLLLTDIKNASFSKIFLAGLCMGLAFIMKQPAVFFIVFGGVLILLETFYFKTIDVKAFLKLGITYSIGAIIPFITLVLWAISIGAFDLFWKWTYTYPRSYAGLLTFSDGIGNLKVMYEFVTFNTYLLYYLSFAGIILSLFNKNKKFTFFLVGYFLFAFIVTAQGMYFRNHYFVVWLPPVMMSASYCIYFVSEKLNRSRPAYIAAPVFAILALLLYTKHKDTLFKLSPKNYSISVYAGNPFNDAVYMSNFIKQRTTPNDKIAVLGSEGEFYFYSQRKAATGFLFMYEVVKHHKYTELWQKELLNQIDSNKPKMIVWANIPFSWLAADTLMNPIIRGINKTLANYHPVLVADMLNPQNTVIKEDTAVYHYRIQSKDFVQIFERNN